MSLSFIYLLIKSNFLASLGDSQAHRTHWSCRLFHIHTSLFSISVLMTALTPFQIWSPSILTRLKTHITWLFTYTSTCVCQRKQEAKCLLYLVAENTTNNLKKQQHFTFKYKLKTEQNWWGNITALHRVLPDNAVFIKNIVNIVLFHHFIFNALLYPSK